MEAEKKESLTDWLALERTKMANQRTLLAMLRTGFYFLVMGITVMSIKELEDLQHHYWVFFLVGVIFIVTGLIHYFYNHKKLMRTYHNWNKK